MEELFYYYTEDAEKKAKEIAAEIDGTIENQSCDKIYNCEPMDRKAETIINNSVSGETGAYWVYDKDYNLMAIVAHWISKEADLDMSIEEFCDNINERTFYPGEMKEAIEYNGWQLIINDDFKAEAYERGCEDLDEKPKPMIVVDSKNGKKLIINDKGETEVIRDEDFGILERDLTSDDSKNDKIENE